jgi:hypothetical protein
MSTGAEIERALAFLAARQLPSGQFGVLRFDDLADPDHAGRPDSTTFATALVAHSLGFANAPVAADMARRAARFLASEMQPGGVWQFWTAQHPGHLYNPPDLDDTACIAGVLRAHGVGVPDHRSLLLANRNRHGVFYTWIAPRLRPPPMHAGFWRIALRRSRSPVRARLFWRMTPSTPTDVDAVVNANVLFYLGESADTAAVVAHLMDVIRRGDEGSCDKWYFSRFALHYMVARCHASGIESLRPIRDTAVARIEGAAQPDGSIGADLLDTALAACALRGWGRGEDTANRATAHLRAQQRADGSWPGVAMYGAGSVGWGSEELTTGFCLEALARCRVT